MSLRLIEIIVPADSVEAIAELPCTRDVLDRWDDNLGKDKTLVRLLVNVHHTEGILDDLESRFSQVDGFRVMLLPVEATLPHPREPENSEPRRKKKSAERISRQELYNYVARSAKISRVFAALKNLKFKNWQYTSGDDRVH